jgi:PAS domain S-box-containing protein
MVNVLLVDDNQAFLDLCCRRLESISDFSVFTALGCDEALDLLESQEFDVVLSDYLLTCKDGLDFFERFESGFDIPLVLMTSQEDPELIEEAFEKGADEYVSKDLSSADYIALKNRIRNLIEGKESEKGDWTWFDDGSLLKQVIGLAPVSIKIKDSEGRIVLANEAFADVMETDVEDLIGETFESSSLTDEQVEVIEETDRHVLENDEKVNIDEQYLTNNLGEEIILRTTKIPFSPEGSSDEYVLTVASDITDQKRREQALENILSASREMAGARSIQDVAEVAVDALDHSREMDASGVALHDSNEGVFKTVAISQDKDIFSDLPELDQDASLAGEVFNQGEAKFYEDLSSEEVLNPDTDIQSEFIMPLGDYGVLISGSTDKRAFDREDINLIEIFGSRIEAALDRAQREQDLRERENQLERQNRRLNKFASIISHDLRNPLNIAKGYLDMSIDKYEDDEDLKEVDSALERMDRIIESLLTLARHTDDLNKEKVSMHEICEDAWSFSKVEGAELNIEDKFEVYADRDKLMHILENLFTNANEHGGENVVVTVGELENGFFIENDGDPIPEDLRQHIFEFGYTGSEEGTGLGLSIVKSIVEFHDWELELKHDESRGPRFEFKF